MVQTDLKINNIPGLIEPIEVAGLEKAASLVQSDEQIIEFGCYLGRSTQAILNGVSEKESNIDLFVYDQYCVHTRDKFSQTLLNHVKSVNLLDQLYMDEEHKEKKLHWEKVFDKLVTGPSNVQLVRKKTYVESAETDGVRSIALLHIDAPKSYDELKPIFYKFFPLLKVNSRVIFQDYFYQWSPTLIAFVEVLKQLNFVEIYEGRASSLEVILQRPLLEQDILNIDLKISMSKNLLHYIEDTINFFKENKDLVDRPEIHIPKLKMAKVLYAKSVRQNNVATQTLIECVRNKEFGAIFPDLLELIEKDFDQYDFLRK